MRPYYTDPYTVDFETNVRRVFPMNGKTAVILEKTYFYPTSGGQEHDTGSINGIPVTDVIEENGEVVHLLSGEIEAGKADCRIDWKRRFENMQQHTGQHVLSAAFENLFTIQTVSSRLGEFVGTIDLSRQPTEPEVRAAVSEANRIVQENRDVVIHFADSSTIGSFKLRKQPKVDGTIRIVEVKDFDFSPCGGTHCTHTSEIGVILTGRIEKIKASSARIEFTCGGRATKRYYALQKSAIESAQLLSSTETETPLAIENLKRQIKDGGDRLKLVTERVLNGVCERFAMQLAASAESMSIFNLTSEVNSAEELRYVASCLSKKSTGSFAVYKNEGSICRMNLNLPRSDAESVMNQLRENFGAKGGGRNGFFSLNFELDQFARVVDKIKEQFQNG